MNGPVIVPIGGFLGAGKSTLILAAARVLKSHGRRVAAVLNDQGTELVDTHLVREKGITADQVAGGCFCCRFSDLIGALDRLKEHRPDVIFAEAVGSCTDISATTLQPLKLDYASQFRLAPFSVLVDPERADELMRPDADPDLAFLFHSQMAEADLLCFTKSDLDIRIPELSGAPVRSLSAVTGQGVTEWLDEILDGELTAGGKILTVDYERYARAEAALAWFNGRVALRLHVAISPAALVGPLLEKLSAAMSAENIRIVHMKLMDECPTGYIKASACNNDDEPRVEGTLDASPSSHHDLLVNIRALGEPEALRRIVEAEWSALPGACEVRLVQCFRPAPPVPERRIGAVV